MAGRAESHLKSNLTPRKGEEHKQKLVAPGPPGRGTLTPTRPWARLTRVWGLLRRQGSAAACHRDWGFGSSSPGMLSVLAYIIFEEITISPTTESPSGQSTNWRTIIPKKFSHCFESSRPHSRLPNLGIQQRDWEFPGNFTLKVIRIWLQNFHRTGETNSQRTQIKTCVPQEKGAVTPQETESDLSVSARESEVGAWVDTGLLQGQGHWQQPSWEVPCASRSPFGRSSGQTIAKHRPTHQQKTGLKIYWAWSCPSEKNPVFPTASPSHQEDYTSLILINQRADRMKTTITEN